MRPTLPCVYGAATRTERREQGILDHPAAFVSEKLQHELFHVGIIW